MAGQLFLFDDFSSLLKMEIGRSLRNREELHRFSLLYFQIHETPERIQEVCSELLRYSDAIFHKEGDFLLILPETDRDGALHIPMLLEKYFKRPVYDAVVSFPEDGKSEEDLIAVLVEAARDTHGIEIAGLFH